MQKHRRSPQNLTEKFHGCLAHRLPASQHPAPRLIIAYILTAEPWGFFLELY